MPGPIAVYPLNAVYHAHPVSPYNVPPGKIVGATLDYGPDGRSGGSYAFAGTAQSYIEIPGGSLLDTRYSISILLHVYPEAVGPLVHFERGGNIWAVHLWLLATTGIYWVIENRYSPGQYKYFSRRVLTMREWNFFAVTYDYNTELSAIWKDGKKVGEINAGKMEISTNNPIRIAAKPNDNRYFKGRICCIQFYNRALSQEEIIGAKTKCQKLGKKS